MPTTAAAALRLEIEHALERKFPAALTPQPRAIYEVAETGVAAVDRLLRGGFPVGAISEVTGPASSGRTSLALKFVAARTEEDRACAWVDVNDAFDPESAAANGVRLGRLLWVRCKTSHPIRDGAAKRMAQPASDIDSCYPRSQKRDLGHPASWKRPEWARLEQGLRATDLLLQAGGFAAIVLDLGDTAPEQATRIPLATWFRYRQAAERTQCSLLVLGQCGYAQSAAAVVLKCEARNIEPAGGTVLRRFDFEVRRERERQAPIEITTRKPPAAAWQANAAWDRERRA